MIKNFAKFWIDNSKVTIVFLMITIFAWIWSYIVIPKQYNPDISVPAFNIIIPAPWFSAQEVKHLVLEPLEDKVLEIKDLDHIYWVANKNFWVLTVRFLVWSSKENAITRLNNKLFENMWNKPFGVMDPIIKKMDSDNFPIYTFAIENKTSDQSDSKEILLRKIAIDVQNKLKFIKWTSNFYLAWWYKNNTNIILDLKKLQWKNIDIMQVYQSLKNNNLVLPWWDLKINNVQSTITVDWNLGDLEALKKLIIWNYNWKPVYLQEVANIFKWFPEKTYFTFINSGKNLLDWNNEDQVIYVWVWKEKQVNSVVLWWKIQDKLNEIQKTLPKWFEIVKLDNQWNVASVATNTLLLNLIESVLIVFLVLYFYLWMKDAVNNAFAIPLVLLMVFLIALIIWDNINRIVLFALVLALWMLVDNSTVVIENIARHLNERKELIKKNKDNSKNKILSIKETILKSVDEVWVWVLLATVTRILALISMFFVTWMMWEYMWWVPKYVIISLVISLFVAFSVNPFLAYIFYKDENKNLEKNIWDEKNIFKKILILQNNFKKRFFWNSEENKNSENIENIEKKEDKEDKKEDKLELFYKNFMKKFLWRRSEKNRKKFKKIFWITLAAVMVLPPVLGIFKMWMLPKDNQNQIYIWVDWQKNWTVKKSKEVADYSNKILSDYFENNQQSKVDKNLKIIKNISYQVWIAPIIDFANAFRWVDFRKNPNQISMRVNLIDKTKRDTSSIDFTMKIRKILEEKVWTKYPTAKIRVLEDPAWPPVRASFMLKIQWERDVKYQDLVDLTRFLKEKIKPILEDTSVQDVYSTIDTYQSDYEIVLDHQLLSSYWLDVQQVAYTIYNLFNWSNVWLVHDNHTKEVIDLHLWIKNSDKFNQNIFNEISFLNKKWQRIYLKQFSKISPKKVENTIFTEDKYNSVYIYWEMWDNTIVYPAWQITTQMFTKNFWWWKFEILSKSPYWVQIQSKLDWQKFRVMWWWERELSLDTFRDLWIAMMMALLAIYFLMVAQFKSFKIARVIMMTFLIWFFWILPWFSLVYESLWVIFTAPSMIWVIALAWIVVWNAIILIEYLNVLLKKWMEKWEALISAWAVRMKAIILTSMTTIMWAFTILWDPVWGWLWWAIVWWLTASAILTLVVIPIFLYDSLDCDVDWNCDVDWRIDIDVDYSRN